MLDHDDGCQDEGAYTTKSSNLLLFMVLQLQSFAWQASDAPSTPLPLAFNYRCLSAYNLQVPFSPESIEKLLNIHSREPEHLQQN